MMLRRPAARRGLSLVEVILSLAILVISLAALAQLVDLGTERARAAQDATRGTRLAQGKMAEVEAGVISLSSSTEGQFTDEDANWKFSVTPEPVGPPYLYNVTVKVTREGGGQPFELVVTQMIFDPAQMGAAAQAEDTASTTTGGTTP